MPFPEGGSKLLKEGNMKFENMTDQEKKIWRSGQGYFVRGRTQKQCPSELIKLGWAYAKKVYAGRRRTQ